MKIPYHTHTPHPKPMLIIKPTGRLGNNIFQWLFGMTMYLKYGVEFIFFENIDWEMDRHRFFQSYKFIKETDIDETEFHKIRENPSLNHYSEELMTIDPNKNYIFEGFFQVYKNYEPFLTTLKQEFFCNVKKNGRI